MTIHPVFEKILTDAQAIPTIVANATAKASPERCGRHSWKRHGGEWSDQENPGYYRCTVCRYEQDEIEHELAETQETVIELTAEVNAETTRADRAETAAKLNADTLAAQRAEYTREVGDLNQKLRNASRRIAELMDAQRELTDRGCRFANEAQAAYLDRDREKAKYRALRDELETSVVTVVEPRQGWLGKYTEPKNRTLWQLYGDGDTRALCTVCSDPDCDGVHEPDGREIAAEAMAEEGD